MHLKNDEAFLRNADLNLFAVFEALERERSVTRAAQTLGLSQPAVSHALNRLRDLMKDQLFTRSATGMEPTPRARELADPIRAAVGQLQATLDIDHFDPETSRERFIIAMNNFAAIVFAAPLAAAITRTAPHVQLVIKPSGTLDLDLLLSRGAVDLVIGGTPGLATTDKRHLLDDRYVAVMRRGHPVATSPLSLGAFAESGHLEISSIGEDTSFIDRELGKHGLKRTIRLEAPYLATGAVLEGCDLIGVVARCIALELCRGHTLIWRDLPIDAPPIGIGMTWPPIYDRRSSHCWLRAMTKALDRSVDVELRATKK